MPPLYFRLRIRDASTVAFPDGTIDVLTVTSLPGSVNPYIEGPPTGSGSTIDPATGAYAIGSYSITVIDAGVPSAGVVTQILADPYGRQQLCNRRSYIDESTDGVTWTSWTAGYLSQCEQITELVWQMTVGDSRRTEQTTKCFVTAAPGLNKMGCIVGGPIIGGFGPVLDKGPTRWTVTAVGSSWPMVELLYQDGWWPSDAVTPGWKYYNGHIPQYGYDRANNPYLQVLGPNAQSAYLRGPVDATLLQPFNPMTGVLTASVVNLTRGTGTPVLVVPNMEAVSTYPNDFTPRALGFIGAQSKITTKRSGRSGAGGLFTPGMPCMYLDWYDPLTLAQLDPATMPQVNDVLAVYVFPTTISADNPLHIDMHPVDLLTALLTNAARSLDATSAANMRILRGPNLRCKYRVDASSTLSDAMQELVLKPHRIGLRNGPTGALEMFSTKIESELLPTIQWTDADLAEPVTQLYNLDESTVYNVARCKSKRLYEFVPQANTNRPNDEVLAVDQYDEIDYGDTQFMGQRPIDLDLPGVISSDGATDGDMYDFLAAWSSELFDRNGRGAIMPVLRVLRSSVQADLGQEVIFTSLRQPNGAARGGPRCLQVIGKTEFPQYFEYQMMDSGAAEQTAIAPTFTLIQSPLDPGHLGQVKITNLSQLLSLYAAQIGTTVSTVSVVPTGHVATDRPVLANQGDSLSFTLPALANGTPNTTITVGFDINVGGLHTSESCLVQLTDPRGGTNSLRYDGGTILNSEQISLAAAYQPGDVVTLRFTYSRGSTPPSGQSGTVTVHNTTDALAGLTLALPTSGGPGIALQFATGSSTPTNGWEWFRRPLAAPPSGLFTGFSLVKGGGLGPFPTAIQTPPEAIGTKIWVSARTTRVGFRPSPWSAWQSITLGTFTGNSGLTATNDGNGVVTLTWTNPDTTTPVQVFIQPHGGSISAYQLIANLAPGSNQYTITGLTPSAQYDAKVQHVAAPPYTDTTTPATVTFTVSVGSATCVAPSNPTIFVTDGFANILTPFLGSSGRIGAYAYGFACTGMDPTSGSQIAILGATELSPGSGTYSSEIVVALVPEKHGQLSVYSDPTRPSDGLRRTFRAVCQRAGADDSDFTPTLTVDPTVVTRPSDYPVPIPSDFAVSVEGVADGPIEDYFLRFTYTPPTDAQFDHMEFRIRSCPIGGTYVSAPTIKVGGSLSSDTIDAAGGAQYEITPVTVTRGGELIPGILQPTQPYQNVGTAVTVQIPFGSPQPNFGTPDADASFAYYTWTMDLYTMDIRVYSKTYASDPGTVDSVEDQANYIPPTLDNTKTSLQLPVDATTNQFRVTTFVPYSAKKVRGIPSTFKSQYNASAGTVNPPTLSLIANPSGGPVQVQATYVTTPVAGDSVHLYRGGVLYQSLTLNAGAVSAGHVTFTDTGVVGSTTYSYTATQTTGGLTSVQSSALNVTTPTPPTLNAPSFSQFQTHLNYNAFHVPSPSCTYIDYTLLAGSGNPSGTLYDIYLSHDNVTFTLFVAGRSSGGGTVARPAFAVCYAKALARLAGYTTSGFSSVVNSPSPGGGCSSP